jgi:hypothetical protein
LRGAGDPVSIKFALVGIVVVLPVVLIYQLYAYRVVRGADHDLEVPYEMPDISTRCTYEREPHLHLS